MTSSADAALGHLLLSICLDKSVDFPIAQFAREMASAKRTMQSLEETIAHRDHDLAQEQGELSSQIDQCLIAREKLSAELQRIDQQLKELRQRQEVVDVTRKFCALSRSVDFTAAASFVAVPEGVSMISHPSTKPSFERHAPATPTPATGDSTAPNGVQGRPAASSAVTSASGGQTFAELAEGLIAALRNPDAKEPVIGSALNRCEAALLADIDAPLPFSFVQPGVALVDEMSRNVHSLRPPLQVVALKVLSMLLKRETVGSMMTPNASNVAALHDATIATGMLSRLVKLFSSVNDDVKCEAFDCVGALLTTEGDSAEFHACGGIAPLVEVIASSTSEVVLERALIIMWTLASVNDTLRSAIRGEGGLRAVLDLLYTDSLVILENVASALGFLTREEATKDAIRDNGGGLEKLVATLFHPSPRIQGKICGAIWNCASSPANRTFLRQIGCIPALLELLATSTNEMVLENSAGALWNLAAEPDNKTQIVDFEGVPILIAHLNTNVVGLLPSVAGALWNLSAHAENRPVIRKAGGIPHVVRLLGHSDEAVIENISGLLRNLVINDQVKSAVRECGGVEKIIAVLATTKNAMVIEKLVSTLWILTVVNESKHQLRAGESIAVLLKHFKAPRTETIREKTLGVLRSACTLPENRPAMLEAGVLQALAEFAAGGDAVLRGAAPTIKESFAALVWHLSREDKEQAARLGLIPPICLLLADRELGVVEQAAGALASITITSAENRIAVREAGGLETALRLVVSLGLEQPVTLINIILLIRNCTSANTSNQQLLVQMRVVQPLLNVVQNGKDDLKREAALCLKNAAGVPQGAAEIVRANGREILALVAEKSPNENARKAALIALQAVNKVVAGQ